MPVGARFEVVLAVAVVACDSTAPPPVTVTDAGTDELDAGTVADAPDAQPPDTEPPRVISAAPEDGREAWLHDAIRFELDEPVTAAELAVTATLDGDAVAATAALDASGRTIVVTIDPSARGIGTLEVALDGTIADAAGNVMAERPALTLSIPAWVRPPVDRGSATDAPSLVVSEVGEVVAAWLVGTGPDRRVAVSRFAHGAWQDLGDVLGASAVSGVAIAIDASARPVVAWLESGQVLVARWDGAAWSALPSPGQGRAIALATGPDGELVCAVAGADVRVQELVADAWQPVGDPLAIGGTLVGDPALARSSGGRVAVGWVEHVGGGARAAVHRFATGWTTMSPLGLGAPPPSGFDRMSLALRGARLAVAYDRWERSSGVFAAIADGDGTTTWTRLGRMLDVDPAGDARTPAIALDASGAPVVAWLEEIEGTWRGVLARWQGDAWRVVGGPSWLPGGRPTRARLALHAEQAPVVGWSAGGAIGVALHNGPRVAQRGLDARPSLAGCAFSAASPPARVLATGCFTLAGPGKPRPHPGLVPYDLISELWSDGTKKRRWLGLATGALTTIANGSYTAPEGAFVVKEFAIETTPGNPATRRAVETRFLVNVDGTWRGFSYRWRADGTDADLLGDESITVSWPLANGGTYTHLHPSRTQCRSCHHPSNGPLLGLRPEQLQRWFDYDGVIAEQLPTLAAIGVAPASNAAPLPSPHDPTESTTRRARAYLHANCAHCHNGSYIGIRDLRFPTPLAQTDLCRSLVPGDADGSRVFQLVTRRPGMPALGTLQVDPLARELVGRWIDGMTSCP